MEYCNDGSTALSDLENISQMILVCDIHCRAETMAHGGEKTVTLFSNQANS